MGFVDKLMFWKKDDIDKDLGALDFGSDPGLGNDPGGFGDSSFNQGFGQNQGLPDIGTYRGIGDRQQQQQINQSIHDQLGPQQPPSFTSAPPTQSYRELTPQAPQNTEMQVISAKLDAVKATLDAINTRLANIEQTNYEQPKKRQVW